MSTLEPKMRAMHHLPEWTGIWHKQYGSTLATLPLVFDTWKVWQPTNEQLRIKWMLWNQNASDKMRVTCHLPEFYLTRTAWSNINHPSFLHLPDHISCIPEFAPLVHFCMKFSYEWLVCFLEIATRILPRIGQIPSRISKIPLTPIWALFKIPLPNL